MENEKRQENQSSLEKLSTVFRPQSGASPVEGGLGVGKVEILLEFGAADKLKKFQRQR